MTLHRLALRTFAWLPLVFGAWALLAGWQSSVAGLLTQGMLAMVYPGLVESVERTGAVLAFVTTVAAGRAQAQAEAGVLVPEINALLYGYGLPLFVALMLAARAPAARIVGGAAMLLPLQALGMALAVLVQLLGHGGGGRAAGLFGWHAEAIALGYQFTTLILPGAAPLVIWCAWNRPLIAQLTGRRAALSPSA